MSQKSTSFFRILALYFIIPMAIAKLLWSVALFFLDKDSLNQQQGGDYSYFYNINLANKIIRTTFSSPFVKEPVENHQRLDDIKLKGTYSADSGSFIVLEDQLGTTFLYKNEKYVGYKLVEIYEDRAVLEKDGKKFDLVLDESKDDKSSSFNKAAKSSNSSGNEGKGASFVPGEPVSLTRNELNSYVKNPNKIWSNIRIQELRRGGVLNGFRVNYVKRGSFFDKAGLKSGDIIKSIDGKVIKTLSDVMRYYSNVDSLDGLTLGVERGGEEIDIEFDVN